MDAIGLGPLTFSSRMKGVSGQVEESGIRVKVLFKSAWDGTPIAEEMLPRFPGGVPRWGACEFIFDRNETRYDWLVVYDDVPPLSDGRFSNGIEVLQCPVQKTLLITTEPSSIKVYGKGFLRQFGHVLTSQEAAFVDHPGAIFSQPALIWFYGRGDERGSYDHMCKHPPIEKSGLISIVCSAKRQKHTLHRRRFDFMQRLGQVLPEVEVYGRGIRPVRDKADALDRFRYHVAVENHIAPHHWTEKLADAFLGHCLPFYVGCPNAADYFPEESFIPLDFEDVERSAAIIRAAVKEDAYSRRLSAIKEARRRVLEKYGLFATISRLVEERDATAVGTASRGDNQILSRKAWRYHRPSNMLQFIGDSLPGSVRQLSGAFGIGIGKGA